jgi:ribosomal protein L40E
MFASRPTAAEASRAPTGRICLQCGTAAHRSDATICRRCGLAYGDPPRQDAVLATCPICYRSTDDDGRLPSLADRSRRLDLHAHIAEHDRFPVGDDEWLETLRRGDRIVVGRFQASFELVRRYLVTGVVDAGRQRAMRHDTIVTAMAQLARWGRDGVPTVGDTDAWREARGAVTALMERYHHPRPTHPR